MEHIFVGKWITDGEFASLRPRNVFHPQLVKVDLPCEEHRNRHILFRKKLNLNKKPKEAKVFISADDYYKLYVNGVFVCQGPAPSYHFNYNYNEVEISEYLCEGENTVAVHTLYQGLINRVWQSGDNRHGLIMDIVADGETVLASDESFLTRPHSAYSEMGVVGYQTQFMERYDSRCAEVGFTLSDFDDSEWEHARIKEFCDYGLTKQKSYGLVFEKKTTFSREVKGNSVILDFGAIYVGYLSLKATGKQGDSVRIRCGQELRDDGSVRYDLRANCIYDEEWILSDGECTLDWFDFKSFRYAEIILPDGATLSEEYMTVRHYPFKLNAKLCKEYENDEEIRRIFELCTNTQKYGVQEVIQDCMEREKGFYLGDGCYTALTNMLLTHDDSMVRKLINDAFSTDFITDTLVTCMDCSFMQEIAEYPLMLVFLVLWHYRFTKDKEYLELNYEKVTKLLDAYRRRYEKDGLLRDLDKWCVVEWPKNFQHGYDVDIREWQVCHEAHVAINAYYIEAVKTANKIAGALGKDKYRDTEPLYNSFVGTFYKPEKHLFRDGENTDHVSLVGNSFALAFELYPNEECRDAIIDLLFEHKISSLSMFCVFPALMGLLRCGRRDLVTQCLKDTGAWLRIIREDGKTTFEGWGRDTKWNTSLFHLTMSYAATFMIDGDVSSIFK